MNRSFQFALLVIALSALLILGVLFPAAVLKIVVEPLAVALWAGWRVVAAVDQRVYWALLVTLSLIVTIRLIPSARSQAQPSAYQHDPRTRTLVERWRRLLEQAARGDPQSPALRECLADLLASCLEDRPSGAAADPDARLASLSRSLPPLAVHYLSPAASGTRRGLSRLPRWLRRRIPAPHHSDLQSVAALIEWMEQNMEIPHDQ